MTSDVERTCADCRTRDAAPKSVPFKEERSILMESHALISLARCSSCHSPWLHFCVEIYDEFWCYWAALTEAEASEYSQWNARSDIDAILEDARQIVRRGTVLEEHPVHGLGWTDGKHALLEGPPW